MGAMKTSKIISMLFILPRLSFGGQCCVVRCHAPRRVASSSSSSLSSSMTCQSHSHRRLHPRQQRRLSCFHAKILSARSTPLWLQLQRTSPFYEDVDQARLGPIPKVTRRRATSAASLFASMDNDDEENFDGISTVDGRPTTGLFLRSAYQFYPIRPGSSRPMPPSISDYHSTDNYNGEEISHLLHDEDNMVNDDYPSDVYDALRDPDEGSSAKKTFKIIQPRELQEPPMIATTEMIPSSDTADNLNTLSEQITASGKNSSNDSFSYKRIVPRVTPSFMEPIKFKALGGSRLSSGKDSLNLNSSQRKLPVEASDGNSSTSLLTTLSRQLEHIKLQIYQLNDGVEFNINSPKQVARVLFGDDEYDTCTNKDVLEAMASAGNEMASCIYKYRKLARDIKREERRLAQQQKGDSKNDYYGNLARHDDRRRNGTNKETPEADNASKSSQPTMPVEIDSTVHRWREPLLLIDASAYIFRAYHAIPPLHRSDGTPTGALHGVCRMLQNLLLTRLLKGDRPRVVLAFDFKGPNFRHDIYSDYKANRGPCPEDLVPQFALIREAAEAFGVVQVEAEGYEADDVIATLTRQALNDGVDVDILSGDKDLMQLITPAGVEPSVHMIDPMHFDRIDHDDVMEKWGVSSDKLGDVLALAGDASDNIPGAPGIGPKIAAALINEFGSLGDLINRADTIKQKKRRESLLDNAEKVLLFRKLVTLDDSIPIDKMTLPTSFHDVSDFRMSPFDPNRLIAFYKEMELHSCENQLESRLRSGWPNFKPPPSPEDVQGVPF